MNKQSIDVDGIHVPVVTLNTVVVGSGAAGLNCACRLFRELEEMGVDDPRGQIALVTQGIGLGTSNNSGSDKQTYYKMGTSGEEADKAADFAETLTAGGCTHADVAFIEGAGSLRGFYRLADLGVPFPHNARGEFVGYKTDHDPRQRGTSAGPWTSRFMVQKLLAELKRYDIKVFNRHHVLAVLPAAEGAGKGVSGLLCVDLDSQGDAGCGLVAFHCRNIVMAGGGPGDLYKISVYPKGQMGPYAAMFAAGAIAQNLTESQFGLASVDPRWNLSGTYQQVIPRYFSTDADGGDEQEFLNPWFESMSVLATDIFLKGYQWPFDHDKVADFGSSLIDILVQNEMVNKGRRVFMDFRENPRATDGLEAFSLTAMGVEALEYLEKSGAMQTTPIERLAHMNQPSIDLYTQMGVDLWTEPLEVGVCSQHCNGGFAVDSWWESNVPNLFVVGELAGTHGVKRPGGSALNSGQVGSMRAAQRIAHVYFQQPAADGTDGFAAHSASAVQKFASLAQGIKSSDGKGLDPEAVKAEIQQRMSRYAGMVRSKEGVATALTEARAQWKRIQDEGLAGGEKWARSIQVRELALAQLGFLSAIEALLARGSGSRGSHLVTDPAGKVPHEALDAEWKFIPENMKLREVILGVSYDASSDGFSAHEIEPKALADCDDWFENTWADYRKAEVFRKLPADDVKPSAIYQKSSH